MELIYQNFDGLDVSFQGALPDLLLQQLAEAKERAQLQKKDAYLELGPNKLRVLVAEAGAKGGYRYRFDTGPDGEIWFIAHSTKYDAWNIRVSVKSLALALYGYAGVKERIYSKLKWLQAAGSEPNETGLLERISRLDYCFDFATKEPFQPNPTNFIAHQRCKKHCYGEQGPITLYNNSSGGFIHTLRVGEMPGRQATIYNKSLEIKARSKNYWLEIWGLAKDDSRTIWRIEVRAGKDELDKWNLKRFIDFENRVGDVITDILKAIRYTLPNGDSNRARWPLASFWRECIDRVSEVLQPHICNGERGKIMQDARLEVLDRYRRSIAGSLIGYTAASDRDISEIEEVMQEFSHEIIEMCTENPEKIREKFKNAEDKFRFLKG